MVERSQYIAGLRELADILEKHEDLELPHEGSGDYTYLTIYPDSSVSLEQFRTFIVAVGDADKEGDDTFFRLRTTLGGKHGLRLEMATYRNEICERRVVGRRKVTKSERDPELVAQIPLVEREVVEDIVEWDCRPLLDPDRG